MSTYQRADDSVNSLARAVIMTYPEHKPLIDAKVKIDFVFAYGNTDDNGATIDFAIKNKGHRVFGQAKKLPLKERALGRGDAEIMLDGDWWADANPEEQKALLDHELYHLTPKAGKTDDLGRPVLRLRRHDVEVGWFSLVASRHGAHSIERKQARALIDSVGQFYWPELANGHAKLPAQTP